MAKNTRKKKDPMQVTEKGYFDLSRKQIFELIEQRQKEIKEAQNEISDWAATIDDLNGDIEELMDILREGADGEMLIHDNENLPRARKYIEELRLQADTLEANMKGIE